MFQMLLQMIVTKVLFNPGFFLYRETRKNIKTFLLIIFFHCSTILLKKYLFLNYIVINLNNTHDSKTI